MNCMKCGTALLNDVKFCSVCGAKCSGNEQNRPVDTVLNEQSSPQVMPQLYVQLPQQIPPQQHVHPQPLQYHAPLVSQPQEKSVVAIIIGFAAAAVLMVVLTVGYFVFFDNTDVPVRTVVADGNRWDDDMGFEWDYITSDWDIGYSAEEDEPADWPTFDDVDDFWPVDVDDELDEIMLGDFAFGQTAMDFFNPNASTRRVVLAGWFPTFFQSDRERPDPNDPGIANFHFAQLQFNNLVRVKNEMNVIIEYVSVYRGTVLADLTAIVMAGDVLGDVHFLPGIDTVTAARTGLIQPLDSFVPANNQIFTDPQTMVVRTWLMGTPWSFDMNSGWNIGPGLRVNLDMMEILGLQNPVDLWYAGEWTWANFRRLAREATFSSTGGSIDHVGLGGDTFALFFHLMAANDGRVINYDNPNNLVLAFNEPNSLQALEFAADMLYFDRSLRILHAYIADENVLMSPHQPWDFYSVPYRFTIVPFPLGPANTSGNTHMQAFPQAHTVPAGVWDPGFVFDVLDQLSRWGETPAQLVEQLEQFRINNWHTAEDMRRFAYIAEHTRSVELGMIMWPLLGDANDAFFNAWVDGTMTVPQAITAYTPQLQAIVDEWAAGRW